MAGAEAILLTGGCGYIGSHVAVLLAEAGYETVLYDNLSNSRAEVAKTVSELSGKRVAFEQGDILDGAHLQKTLRQYNIGAVIHFAGLKSVSESVSQPLAYYRANVGGSLTLLQAMKEAGVQKLLYSSSAAVYGEAQNMPVGESATPAPVNPYGNSKWLVEQIMHDMSAVSDKLAFCALRYFNPVGAHASGRIGDNPTNPPNNLVPLVVRAANGGDELAIFGDDYPTKDGTCIRDYIHISDLAEGHIAALRFLQGTNGYHCFNLGSTAGASVKQVIAAYERVKGTPVPHRITGRRPGDVAVLLADCRKAEKVLGWKAKRTLDEMLKTV